MPAEVWTILTVYTALGLALSIAIPFFIMLLFSIVFITPFKIEKGKFVVEKAGQRKMFQYVVVAFLWLLFVGFIIYKLIIGWEILSYGMLIVFGVIILVGIIFIIKPS